jgi:prepilin-type processing-associated H-X9-DG protein
MPWIPTDRANSPSPRQWRRCVPGAIDAQVGGGIGCIALIAIIAAILFPVFAQSREEARLVSSESNLKQIGLASLMYAQDHTEHFPQMDTMDHFRAAVLPYLGQNPSPTLFVEPGTDQPYVLNAAMSNHSLDSIAQPAATWLAREPVPHSGGQTAILYCDGHVRAVTGP